MSPIFGNFLAVESLFVLNPTIFNFRLNTSLVSPKLNADGQLRHQLKSSKQKIKSSLSNQQFPICKTKARWDRLTVRIKKHLKLKLKMEYSVPEKRELSESEVNLLRYLFEKEKPEWINLIDSLKVIGRCGCGKCPTIMFGENYNSDVLANQKLLTDYIGKYEENNLIGILLFGNSQIPTELEFYSIDSKTELIEISKIHSIKPNIN
ncbi:MAG: hypothetical protein ACI85I_002261 [Arenicella sp.]